MIAYWFVFGRPAGPPPPPSYWRTVRVAAVTLTSVVIPETGSILVNYSDGTQREFADRAAIRAAVSEVFSPSQMQDVLLARWSALNPALDNPDEINGTTLEVSLSSVLNPVTIG